MTSARLDSMNKCMLPVGVFFPSLPYERERRDSRTGRCRLRSSRRRSFGVRILSAACSQAIRPSTARVQGSFANSPSAPRNSAQHAKCSTTSIDPFGSPSPNNQCRFAATCAAKLPARIAIVVCIRFDWRRYGIGKRLPAPLGIGPARRRNGVSRPMERPRSEGLGGFWPIEHQMSG